jgi:hypothetical protein
MKIDKRILSWLTTVPAGDTNFKWNLKEANKVTLQAALRNKKISKTTRKSIEIQLRRVDITRIGRTLRPK